MSRLNSKVTFSNVSEAEPEEFSALPLYVGNLIYLPFARHLAKEDAEAEEFDRAA